MKNTSQPSSRAYARAAKDSLGSQGSSVDLDDQNEQEASNIGPHHTSAQSKVYLINNQQRRLTNQQSHNQIYKSASFKVGQVMSGSKNQYSTGNLHKGVEIKKINSSLINNKKNMTNSRSNAAYSSQQALMLQAQKKDSTTMKQKQGATQNRMTKTGMSGGQVPQKNRPARPVKASSPNQRIPKELQQQKHIIPKFQNFPNNSKKLGADDSAGAFGKFKPFKNQEGPGPADNELQSDNIPLESSRSKRTPESSSLMSTSNAGQLAQHQSMSQKFAQKNLNSTKQVLFQQQKEMFEKQVVISQNKTVKKRPANMKTSRITDAYEDAGPQVMPIDLISQESRKGTQYQSQVQLESKVFSVSGLSFQEEADLLRVPVNKTQQRVNQIEKERKQRELLKVKVIQQKTYRESAQNMDMNKQKTLFETAKKVLEQVQKQPGSQMELTDSVPKKDKASKMARNSIEKPFSQTAFQADSERRKKPSNRTPQAPLQDMASQDLSPSLDQQLEEEQSFGFLESSSRPASIKGFSKPKQSIPIIQDSQAKMSIKQTIENISSHLSESSNFDNLSPQSSGRQSEKNLAPQLTRRTRGMSHYSAHSDKKSADGSEFSNSQTDSQPKFAMNSEQRVVSKREALGSSSHRAGGGMSLMERNSQNGQEVSKRQKANMNRDTMKAIQGTNKQAEVQVLLSEENFQKPEGKVVRERRPKEARKKMTIEEMMKQESEIEIESKIQDTERIKAISKNKHNRMLSQGRGLKTETTKLHPSAKITQLPEGNKLSLRLANLKVLQLSHFADFQKLTHIDIRNNRLAQLPDQVCDVTDLQEMKLDYNFLNSLPHKINKLSKLQYLSASQNNLKLIPPTLASLGAKFKVLILNDNKIQQIHAKMGNLTSLEILLLHNNLIVDIPSSMYRLRHLHQLSLDWFAYLNNEKISIQTKILKGVDPTVETKPQSKLQADEAETARKHQEVIQQYIDMCKLVQIVEMQKQLEDRQQLMHNNPQQDDYEPNSNIQMYYQTSTHKDIPTSMTKGVTSKNRRDKFQRSGAAADAAEQEFDPLLLQKSVKINFLKFLMFFNGTAQIDLLIMKAAFPSKQRKLSHLIAIYGHQYLLKDVLKQIDLYHHNCLSSTRHLNSLESPDIASQKALKILQTQYQFLNSIDRDFSTPLILALKNKRNSIVKVLLDHPKTCLKQASMKYGTPLHVSIANHEFKVAQRLLRMIKNVKDFNLNKLDEEGNTSLHLLMRNFNTDPELARKLAINLIKKGATLQFQNKNQLTPLHQALYYGQNEAIKFALNHNYQLRRSKNHDKYSLFDFKEQAGKLHFTPLHYAVYQSNFPLLIMLLRSEEDIDHEIEDSEGRKPIDLCNSISSIFKTLRTELKNQRARFLRSNIQKIQQQEAKFQPVHQHMLKNMNITHLHVNKRAMKKRAIQMAIVEGSKSSLNLFSQRNLSVQHNLYKSASLLDTPQSKPNQISGPSTLDRKQQSRAGVPRQLPNAFGRKVSQQHAKPHNKLVGFGKFQKTSVQIDSTQQLNLSQLLQHKNLALYQNERQKMLTQRDTPAKSPRNQSPLRDEEDDFSMEVETINHVNTSKLNNVSLLDGKKQFKGINNLTQRIEPSILKRKRSFDDVDKSLQMLPSRNQAQRLALVSNSQNDQVSIDNNFQPKSINQVIAEYVEADEGAGASQTLETQLRGHDRQLSFGVFDHPETDYAAKTNYLPQKTNLETTEQLDMERLVKPSENFLLHDQDLWGSSSDGEDSVRDQSEQEDANVSDENGDEEDLYEYNPATAYGSPPVSHLESVSHGVFRNSFQEQKLDSARQNDRLKNLDPRHSLSEVAGSRQPSIDDYQDAEHLVRELLKVHHIEDATRQLALVQSITDSLQGRLFQSPATALRKSAKTEQVIAAASEEFKDINNFDDLELTEEELSDSEKNTIQFARNHNDLRFSDMNDIMMNGSEERSIEPIHHSQASVRPNNIRSALSGVHDKALDLLDETDCQAGPYTHMAASQVIAQQPSPDQPSKESTFSRKRQSYLRHNLNNQVLIDDEVILRDKPAPRRTTKPYRTATEATESSPDHLNNRTLEDLPPSGSHKPPPQALPGPNQLSGKKKLMKLISMARKKPEAEQRKARR